MSGIARAPRAIAKRVRQIGPATKPLNANEKDRIS